jgi:hypothetical protein
MQQAHRILTPEACDAIIANLDDCIAYFERKPGMLSAAEIRAKSLLLVVRDEIVRGKEGGSPTSASQFSKLSFD